MIEDRTTQLMELYRTQSPLERPLPTGRKHANGCAHSDAEIIEKARSRKNGKFGRLLRGDLSDYDDDHSVGDDAFVHILYFYTQDPSQIKRIHAQSGLHRPEKSGRRLDYLERSIRRAERNVNQVYEWPDDVPVTAGETSSSSSFSYRHNDDDDGFTAVEYSQIRAVAFTNMGEPKEQDYIVDDLIPESYPAIMFGDGGSAKSMLALSLGVAVSGGANEWLGRRISKAPVLVADFELDVDEQNRRVRRIARGAGLPGPPNDLYYLAALGHSPLEALKATYAECKRLGIKLLILDSFGPAFQGDSEKGREIIGFFGRVMEPFRALGVAVIVIDHQARTQAVERYQNKSAFGSVYKTNLARSVIQVEATERGENSLTVKLRQKKHTFGALSEPFGAKITFGDSVIVEHLELNDADLAEEGTLNSTDRVKMALKEEPSYPDELAQRTGLALGTVKNALTKLRKARIVEPTGERRPGGGEQVRLSQPSVSVTTSSPSLFLRGSDGDDDLPVGFVARSLSSPPLDSDDTPRSTTSVSGEQCREIKKLMGHGMSEELARAEVLGEEIEI